MSIYVQTVESQAGLLLSRRFFYECSVIPQSQKQQPAQDRKTFTTAAQNRENGRGIKCGRSGVMTKAEKSRKFACRWRHSFSSKKKGFQSRKMFLKACRHEKSISFVPGPFSASAGKRKRRKFSDESLHSSAIPIFSVRR